MHSDAVTAWQEYPIHRHADPCWPLHSRRRICTDVCGKSKRMTDRSRARLSRDSQLKCLSRHLRRSGTLSTTDPVEDVEDYWWTILAERDGLQFGLVSAAQAQRSPKSNLRRIGITGRPQVSRICCSHWRALS